MNYSSQEIAYKVAVSLVFGLLGFVINFYTIIFPLGDYTVAVLFGLLFPLLVSLSWGWKYGLLSALAGGCQSMWWLWGPSNGYAVFLIVPPFTLWIVWHGVFAEKRRKASTRRWYYGKYCAEIPFRLLCSLNLLTTTRWAVAQNPPPWEWAPQAVSSVPMEFSIFIVIKQASVAYVLLLLADVLLINSWVRRFFRLPPVIDQQRTGHVISIFLLMGGLFWLGDSILHNIIDDSGMSFVDFFARNIPEENLWTRLIFLLFCLVSGVVMAQILRLQREGERALKKAQVDAESREAFMRSLIEAIPDNVWTKDRDGAYVSCNTGVEQFFGEKESKILGRTDFDLFDRDIAVSFRKSDLKVMETKEMAVANVEVTSPATGESGLFETTKVPLLDSGGDVTGVLGLSRDITEKVRLQDQLAHAQKMESVGRLAGGVAHDFNNMLSVIIGEAELLKEDLPPASPFQANLDEILKAGYRSADLTRRLLAFARKQTIAPKVLSINEGVSTTLKMLKRLMGEDIELLYHPNPEVWPTMIDPSQLDQILANLCVNARDAIAGTGKVTIETNNAVFDDEYCRLHSGYVPGEYVTLIITDDGCGMDKSTLQYIFEPFYTTKKMDKGTGLGMATVYGIVRQNNGFINVYSEVGAGTSIKIYLPRHTRPVEDIEEVMVEEEVQKGCETILVVEDEPAILDMIQQVLLRLGYAVFPAGSPSAALELVRTHSGGLDLLLTDVIMPEMNGRELTEKIQAAFPCVKTLYMSGYTANVIAHHGVLDPDVAFIAKPFATKDLAAAIRKAIGSP